MKSDTYRYKFNENVPRREVRDTYFLSRLAAEGIHGVTQVLLDAGFRLDEKTRACVVEARTPVGRTISQIFTGLLAREFGYRAFSVEFIEENSAAARTAAL